MAIPTPKVEVGFDLTDSPIGPFFALDDPVRGVLDNTAYTLGGTIFVDITESVRTINISRGRGRLFDNYQSGACNVELNNHDRTFDPLYELSPYAGNIIPRREIRVSSGGERQFTGWIEDWDMSYTPDGDSTTLAKANDALYIFAGQAVSAGTPTEQLTGSRINAILDEVGWANDLRQIDDGLATLGTQPLEDSKNALVHLQDVSSSDPGEFFVGKSGSAIFLDRGTYPTSTDTTLFSKTNGIPFTNLEVVYGSELLYNEITVSRLGGGEVVATDSSSIGEYGRRSLEVSELLIADDADLFDYATTFITKYSQPDYRFDSFEIELSKITPTQQAEVLALELGSIVQVEFEPNDIPPSIDRYLKVIRIDHRVTSREHYVVLGFGSVTDTPLILDDVAFGKLDEATLSW